MAETDCAICYETRVPRLRTGVVDETFEKKNDKWLMIKCVLQLRMGEFVHVCALSHSMSQQHNATHSSIATQFPVDGH